MKTGRVVGTSVRETTTLFPLWPQFQYHQLTKKMPSFIPKFVQDLPGRLLRAWEGPHIPEQEKPVLTARAAILLTVVAAAIFVMLWMWLPAGTQTIRAVGIYAFGLSAFLWFAAATIPTPLPLAFMSSPPPKVIMRVKCQSWLNQVGAIFTAVGLILQYIPVTTP